MASTSNAKKKMSLQKKHNLIGWAFLIPASLLIFVFCFYPMFQAILLSFKKGMGAAQTWAGIANLVSYSMIFKSLFAPDGFVNMILTKTGIGAVDWFQNAWAARFVIIIALVWRWTGYNMVFYLAGLLNIDQSIYEASRIDGATAFQQFFKITIPLLKPTILLTAIMSTSGTLQLFDESVNLTAGGPGKSTMTLAHYIFNISFVETPKFNYAAALSVFILVSVAILSAIQMKVGDSRD